MKQILFTLFFLYLSAFSYSQIVASSCIAPDSVIAKYKDDADRLALQYIYNNQLFDTNYINIPEQYAKPYLDALIAVYNATGLSARDTVIEKLNIHCFLSPIMNSFYISADSNLQWMQNLKNGITPCGNSTIDQLNSNYNIYLSSYSTHFNLYHFHTANFQTDSNYNLPPLLSMYSPISGLMWVESASVFGDGNRLSGSINSDHIELVYSYGWGDCPAGCINRRYWKFRVYDDCSVEFVSSWGDQLPYTNINNQTNKHPIQIIPNPFANTIKVKSLDNECAYTLRNTSGQTIRQGYTVKGEIRNLETLRTGLYFLQLKSQDLHITTKIIKL